jgi:hypothetical protein
MCCCKVAGCLALLVRHSAYVSGGHLALLVDVLGPDGSAQLERAEHVTCMKAKAVILVIGSHQSALRVLRNMAPSVADSRIYTESLHQLHTREPESRVCPTVPACLTIERAAGRERVVHDVNTIRCDPLRGGTVMRRPPAAEMRLVACRGSHGASGPRVHVPKVPTIRVTRHPADGHE